MKVPQSLSSVSAYMSVYKHGHQSFLLVIVNNKKLRRSFAKIFIKKDLVNKKQHPIEQCLHDKYIKYISLCTDLLQWVSVLVKISIFHLPLFQPVHNTQIKVFNKYLFLFCKTLNQLLLFLYYTCIIYIIFMYRYTCR